MNYILRVSEEINWKVKVVLYGVSLMKFFWDIQGDQMESEIGVTRCIIDEMHSWDIQGDKIVGESGVTRSMIDELLSSDIQGD